MAIFCPEKQNYALYLDCEECETKTCEAFFCLVVGSRTFADYDVLCAKLDYLLQNQSRVVIISGGAKGADSLAEKYAKDRGFDLMIFPADWNKHGISAGYIRNEQMHRFVSHFRKRGCVAFWDGRSKGTRHSFGLAKK